MTKLSTLRSRLSVLHRRRWLVRWGLALSAMLLVVVGVLSMTFALDWFFDMTRLQRLVTMVLDGVLFVWAFRRLAWPYLKVRETEIDLAFLVERQQKIEGDLVAALQFEQAEAKQWGSTQLRTAVIDYVAEFGKGLNVLEGFSATKLVRRAVILCITLAAVGSLVAVYPDYVRAFFQRLSLHSARYPTRTVLEELWVNGSSVEVDRESDVVSPFGLPIQLVVHGSGELPSEGKIVVQSLDGRVSSTVKLTREGAEESSYKAQLSEVVDPLSFQVFLGDTRTELVRIKVLPLPVIETRFMVTAPEYASAGVKKSAPQSARQLTVLEGSRVDLEVICSNKTLTEAILVVEGTKYALRPTASGWILPAKDSPLALIDQPLRYEIQVADEDGLHLPQPLRGSIRIKPDQSPQIAGGVLTRFVLPTARPPIRYQATDDYGIAKLVAHLDVVRKDGRTEVQRTLTMRELPKPLLRDELPYKGVYRLELSPLQLNKGDRLTVTLEAVDYRGTLPGHSTISDPFVFEISDEASILEDIARPDFRSAEELDAIIRQQLNIGGSR